LHFYIAIFVTQYIVTPLVVSNIIKIKKNDFSNLVYKHYLNE